MKKILYSLFIIAQVSHLSFAQTGYSSLEIGYDVSTDLPLGVVLGINGHVYIADGKYYDKNDVEKYNLTDAEATVRALDPGRIIDSQYKDDFLLWVERGVVSEDLAIADRSIWLADYVFDEEYDLPSLDETQSYVEKNEHLPGVIGQCEFDDQGFYRINEMLIGQLKNLEELLLHTIEQEKMIQTQTEENESLTTLVNSLEERLQKLE